VGAGLGVAIDAKTHAARLSPIAAGYAIALPVAVFLLAVWALRVQRTIAVPVGAGLVLAAPFGPAPVYLTAAVAGALVGVMALIRDRRAR
ncbi:MAG: low temperature requirement protein A, partial [Dactylosporangium sp.]|nr:low temperature requirement protein A [Dactylosporangium sp.]